MSTASKALRRRLEVAALFAEAQDMGREWLASDQYVFFQRAGRRDPISPERDEKIVALYLAGASPSEAGRLTDVSESTVREVLAWAGVRLRRRVFPRPAEARALPLLASGLPWRAIAERLGISPTRVWKLAARAQAEGRLERRRPPRREAA